MLPNGKDNIFLLTVIQDAEEGVILENRDISGPFQSMIWELESELGISMQGNLME